MPGRVAHHEQGVAVGQFDGAEPVAADAEARLRGQVGDVDAQPGQLYGLLRQRQQRFLQPGGHQALGLEHTVLGEHRPLARNEGEFGAALRGEVLHEAVHLDGRAPGVGHRLGDHPQMPEALPGDDPERHVTGPPVPHQLPDGPGQRRHVIGQGERGQLGQRDDPARRIALQDGEDLGGPVPLTRVQVPGGPAEIAEPLHIGEPLFLPVGGVVADPAEDQPVVQPHHARRVRGQFTDPGHHLLPGERLAVVRRLTGQHRQTPVPQRVVGDFGPALQEAQADQLAPAAAHGVGGHAGRGIDAEVLDLPRRGAQRGEEHRGDGQPVEHGLHGVRGSGGGGARPGAEGAQRARAQLGHGRQVFPYPGREGALAAAQDPERHVGRLTGHHRQPGP
nr:MULTISPECIES: hypothetical protein [unclassified Streptomyces]